MSSIEMFERNGFEELYEAHSKIYAKNPDGSFKFDWLDALSAAKVAANELRSVFNYDDRTADEMDDAAQSLAYQLHVLEGWPVYIEERHA